MIDDEPLAFIGGSRRHVEKPVSRNGRGINPLIGVVKVSERGGAGVGGTILEELFGSKNAQVVAGVFGRVDVEGVVNIDSGERGVGAIYADIYRQVVRIVYRLVANYDRFKPVRLYNEARRLINGGDTSKGGTARTVGDRKGISIQAGECEGCGRFSSVKRGVGEVAG